MLGCIQPMSSPMMKRMFGFCVPPACACASWTLSNAMEWAPFLRQPVKAQFSLNGEETMSVSRRNFTKEFKEAAVRQLELGASLAEVARACEVNPNVLHRWKRELRDYGVKAFAGNGKARAEDSRVGELERKVG